MKIAVLTYIHGSLEALEAVSDYLKQQNSDRDGVVPASTVSSAGPESTLS